MSKENSELKSQLNEVNKAEKINGMDISKMVELLKEDEINNPDTFLYYIYDDAYSCINLLELFMGLGGSNEYSNLKNVSDIEELRKLMAFNLITENAVITDKGSMLYTYVLQNVIHWESNERFHYER